MIAVAATGPLTDTRYEYSCEDFVQLIDDPSGPHCEHGTSSLTVCAKWSAAECDFKTSTNWLLYAPCGPTSRFKVAEFVGPGGVSAVCFPHAPSSLPPVAALLAGWV